MYKDISNCYHLAMAYINLRFLSHKLSSNMRIVNFAERSSMALFLELLLSDSVDFFGACILLKCREARL